MGPAAVSRSVRGEGRCRELSLFNSPLLLGFEHFERARRPGQQVSGDGYPPYNIEQLGENELRITLAVAGFTMGDLTITIEDNQLVIRGKQTDDGQRVYLHRGIAARQFQRSFRARRGDRGARRLARQRAAPRGSHPANVEPRVRIDSDPRRRERPRTNPPGKSAAAADPPPRFG